MKSFNIQSLWVVLLSLTSVLLFSCQEAPVDFSTHVAPIIEQHCTPCHNKNGAAPFVLEDYWQVKQKAKMIAYVTQHRIMPPWPADPSYSHFIGERLLSEADIQTLKSWYEQGCPKGDDSHLKLKYNAISSMSLGKPDMVIDVTPVNILNNNKDQFLVIKIPYEMSRPKFVRAVEFLPGKIQYTHHVNGHYLSMDDQTNPFAGNRMLSVEDPDYEQAFLGLQLTNSNGTMPQRVHSAFNFLPGAYGVAYPSGIGGFWMSAKGAFVANDMHIGPSTKACTDSSKLLIYFSDKPNQRPTSEWMMGTNGISAIQPPLQIAPNTISKHFSRTRIYSDVSVLTVNPHMHLIGKSFKAYAILPNGDTTHLISIPRWQFRWQYFYTFTHPLRLPRGTEVVVEAVFDNTLKNPNNPFNPPRLIGERMDRGGASMRTTDEMLQFIITYMPYQKGDETIDLTQP